MRAGSTVLALVMLTGSCATAPAPVVAPAPPEAPPPPAPAPVPESPALESLSVCVVRDGALSEVPVTYNPATGDSTYQGQRFGDAFPADSSFAIGTAWYHTREPIKIFGRRYLQYGLPRVLQPSDVVARGTYRGIPFFVEPMASTVPEVLFLPLRPTCEFQTYQIGEHGEPIRGG